MIDHVFMLVEASGPEIPYLASLGLKETYRRTHHGQGTSNICYCFDNMFLEMLWVDDPAAATSEAIERTRLHERSLWRSNGACPFGVAWRRTAEGLRSAIPTWRFSPPYLPAGLSIAVAADRDDPRQPMMFESPGSKPPVEWAPEKRGTLQRSAGFGSVVDLALTMPADVAPSAALLAIARHSEPPIRLGAADMARLHLRAVSIDGARHLQISLPPA